MSDLTLKPELEATQGGDKRIAVPVLATGAGAERRKGAGARSPRRRYTATRLSLSADDGFRLFRVY